jgi:hypothetical protein
MNFASYFAIESKLKQRGFDCDRAEMISDFTNGKKSSLKSLNSHEYREFINHLNRIIANTAPKVPQSAIHNPQSAIGNPQSAIQKDWQQTPENIMRRKILALFYKMGYRANGKTDIQKVNTWCANYGRFKKELNAHKHDELTQLVSQVEKVYKSYLETL